MLEGHTEATSVKPCCAYTSFMTQLPDHLERYLAICQQVYERMRAEGSWPWPDDVLGDSNGDTVPPSKS